MQGTKNINMKNIFFILFAFFLCFKIGATEVPKKNNVDTLSDWDAQVPKLVENQFYFFPIRLENGQKKFEKIKYLFHVSQTEIIVKDENGATCSLKKIKPE